MEKFKALKTKIKKWVSFKAKKLAPFISDELYLKLRFWGRVGYWPNLKNPKSFNEKLNWLKLNNIHKEYTKLVDKVSAKDFVGRIIGEEYIIPTYKIWDSVEEIDLNVLPEQFVLKNTGDSGGIVICKNKAELNMQIVKAKLNLGIQQNYYQYNKEYPYKDVKPRIIAEKYMEDESGYELKDYKIFCFNGEPKILFVASDRQLPGEDTKFDFFDIEWNHLPFTNGHPNSTKKILKPKNFEQMLQLAKKIASEIDSPQVRIDLYNCDGIIYFGEITFFHNSGMTAFVPVEWDYKLGSLIRL